ncbi:MAG: hypothetical protein Q4G33_13025 [bacterium]|nr:hypothetical protein [bacterium]
MTPRVAPGAITVDCKADGTNINTINADLTDVYAGDKYTYYYPAYVLYEGDYYKADATEYGAEIDVTAEPQVFTVNYTKVTDSTIIAYIEESELTAVKNGATGHQVNKKTEVRYSGGAASSIQGTNSYFSVDVNIPADGNYTFAGPLYNADSKSRGVSIYIDSVEDANKLDTVSLNGYESGEFNVSADLTAGTHTVIYYTDYSLTPVFDYMIVTQNSAPVVPEKTLPTVTVEEGDYYIENAGNPARTYLGKFTVGENNYSVSGIKWTATQGDKSGTATSTFGEGTVITNTEVVTGLVVSAETLEGITVTAECIAATAE